MKVFIIIILWIVITLMTGCNKKEIDISVENTQSQESRVDEKNLIQYKTHRKKNHR